MIGAVFALARGIPILLWVCIALGGWGLYERHGKVSWKNQHTLLKAENAVATIAALDRANTESARRNAELTGEIDDARKREARSAADAASATAAAGRLSGQLAAVKRLVGAAGDPATATQLQDARAAVGVLADLLGERSRADRARSSFADAAVSAQAGCQRQYQSLTPLPEKPAP